MKRWFAYSGFFNGSFGVASTIIEVYDRRNDRPVATFATEEEANTYISSQPFDPRIYLRVRSSTGTKPTRGGVFRVDLTPLPVFDRPFTILRTRGFWDTIASPTGLTATTAVNFAFGLHVMPVGAVYSRAVDPNDVLVYTPAAVDQLPNPLLDDVGWFAYESFVRLVAQQANVVHDPPFDSKSKRKVPANSALVCVGASEIGLEASNLNATFGIRFRMLVDF